MEGDIRGSQYLNTVRKIEKLSKSAWKKKKKSSIPQYRKPPSPRHHVNMYTILIGCLSISDARQPEVDFLHSWALILNIFLGQIISMRIKTLGNTNISASRLIKREKGSLPVDVLRSKIIGTLRSDGADGDENVEKTIVFIRKTTTLHVHHAFLYISLPVFARLRRENAWFHVLWST